MEIDNRFVAWQEANKTLLSSDMENYEITVKMDASTRPSSDVLSLCYLYPLAYSLRALKKISAERKLKVNISFPPEVSQEKRFGQTQRIKIFLAMMWLKDYIELKVDNRLLFPQKINEQIVIEELPKLSETGRLFPLYEATGDSIESENGLESSYHLFRRTFSELQAQGESLRFPFLKIVQSMYRFIENDNEYQGTREHIVTAENKKELRRKLASEVEAWSREISVLALAIWLMLLRDLIETKQIIEFSESEAPAIDENMLTKSRMDAITYGEAMYQLIENACLHSDGKRAWFGFRMHKILSINKSGDQAYGGHVTNRYSNCFPSEKPNGFDDHVSRLFEFYIVDSAYQQGGMTGHYNETIFQAIKEAAYKEMKNGGVSYSLPLTRQDPIALSPEWKQAEEAVFSKDEYQRRYIKHINDLFGLKPRLNNKESYIEDLSVHYGLRLLRKIVSVNDGYLRGLSPCGADKTQFYYNGQTDEKGGSSYVTLWSALLPLQYSWKGWSRKGKDEVPIETLDDPTASPREYLIHLDADTLSARKETSISSRSWTKADEIKTYRKSLAKHLNAQNQDLSKSVLVLEAGETLDEQEILVKSLFGQLVDLLFKDNEKFALRIAIILPNLSRVYEFVRLFSILYYDGKLSIMRCVQIALCVKSDHPIESLYVGCILAQEHLSTTYEIARRFIYHYPEHTLCTLPILSYLIPQANKTGDSSDPISDVSLFPFDLFLSKEMPISTNLDMIKKDWKENIFLDRIERILSTEIEKTSYGCMIRDTHVRLGSKIHLDRFYEAELLFHNTGNIARFAYMLAQDLLHGPNKLAQNDSVLLLGYEKFSAPLMMQIELWLRKAAIFRFVSTAIIHDSGERKKEVRFKWLSKPSEEEISDTTQVVSVVPVGTTLSTIYKLHNTAMRECPSLSKNAFTRNYSIVLIGNHADTREKHLTPVTQRFWNNIQVSERLVTVQPECYAGISASVRYLARVDANWYPPEECPMCKNDSNPLPILDVKHSETLPAAIFLLRDPRQGRFHELVESQEMNIKRLAALLNHVHYSHICSGNNHFQFYIDFQDLFAKNASDINEYFKGVNVEPNAFHILISPLQISNSSIADTVIRQVFKGCSRFLYFNISDAYREEVRTKFSHVTQDYLQLKQYDPNAKLHIHYVDNSIVNGALISRARILMKMLMTQSKLDDNDVILFDRVFLLVNRSSFDTINSYVRNPREHLHAYIHLSIPSYNTENDFCPACQLVEKYRLLRKRSSSEMLDLEFARLVKKHTKRTEEEYKDTLEHDILHSPSYFGWVRQWLHINVTSNWIFSMVSLPNDLNSKKEIKSDIEEDIKVANELKERINQYLVQFFQKADKAIDKSEGVKDKPLEEDSKYYVWQELLHELSDVSLKDILSAGPEDKVFEEAVVELVRKYLVEPRDYMRLYSMETAYEALEDKTQPETCEQIILKLIDQKLCSFNLEKKLPPGLNSEQAKRLCFVYNAEWLISYIKVLSRAQLSNYYVYRQAIVGIISTIITLMAASKKQFKERCNKLIDPHWKKILKTLEYALGYQQNQDTDEICPLICYQLNITLIHRLCDLQARWIVTANNVQSYVDLYMDCVKRVFFKKDLQINLPTERAAILRYMKALKTATMSSEDDMPCLELADIPNTLLAADSKSTARKNMLTTIARFIEVENSRMLYSGMNDLEKKVAANRFDTKLENYRPSENFCELIIAVNKCVMQELRICYGGTNQVYHESYLLYQNYLGNFCRFWHKANTDSPYKTPTCSVQAVCQDKQIIGQVSYMLQYFLRLRSLSTHQQGIDQIGNIPYAYEELCRAICGLSGFDMCYIVFRGVGRLPEIIAQSGYYVPFMEKQKILTIVEIDQILVEFHSDSEKSFRLSVNEDSSEANNVTTWFVLPCVLCYMKEERQVLALELAIHDSQHSNDHFYIILQNEKEQPTHLDEKSILTIARNILFMRFTLLDVLTRDYALLANFRFDCSYIRAMREKKDAPPATKILHLSDLHVDQDNVSLLIKKVSEKISEDFRKNYPIDLLVISGDIADGKNANASVMEERYRCVERLLNTIVMCLWQDSMAYLSHDWRRRVVITTGNHDYASMNQYNAQLDMRTLVSGTPVKEETGTMSKFSYFIHFLIRYLDPPISELLSHDLNEIRDYRFLNLKLLCLNCSSLATPYRTNKMGVNKEVVLGLTKRAMWTESQKKIFPTPGNPHRICVAHYSPEYNLSYFRDSYHTLPGFEWSQYPDDDSCFSVNRLEKRFREILLKEHIARTDLSRTIEWKTDFQKEKEDFLKLYHSMMEAIQALKNGESSPNSDAQPFHNHLKSKLSTDHDLFSEKKFPLLRYLRQFCEWLESKEKNKQNENIAQFLKEASEHIRMGEIDSECYNKLIKEIHDKHHLAVILAGHIHAYDESLKKEGLSILVSDKLYNPANSNELNGYVIEFNSSSAHPSFTHRRLSDPSLMSSPKKE